MARKYKMDPVWKKTRAVHLMTYPECRACGTRDNVVVHHIRYRGKRGYAERPGDLMTLCKFHHDDFHHRYKMRALVANSIAYAEAIAQQVLSEAGIG